MVLHWSEDLCIVVVSDSSITWCVMVDSTDNLISLDKIYLFVDLVYLMAPSTAMIAPEENHTEIWTSMDGLFEFYIWGNVAMFNNCFISIEFKGL